jgi:hypothetical protein
MLIMYKNALELGGSVVASSQNVYFPASNILSNLASDVWRSGATLATETLTITLDRNYNNETLYLVLHGFDFTHVTALTYQLGALGAVPIVGYTNGVAFVTVIAVPAINENTLVLTFTKDMAANYVQVGKIFIGNGFDNAPVDEPDKNGYHHEFYEGINKDYSIAGQKFSEGRYQSWHGSIDIPYIPDQVMHDTVRPWLQTVGTFQPFFIMVDNYANNGLGPEALASDQLAQVRYVTLSTVAKESFVFYGELGYYWKLSLMLEEQL